MSELVSHEQFFAPMASDFIDGLIAAYRSERKTSQELGAFVCVALGYAAALLAVEEWHDK